jgi:hypothetical protein
MTIFYLKKVVLMELYSGICIPEPIQQKKKFSMEKTYILFSFKC